MHLMRIGPFASEAPAARVDDNHYVGLSDTVTEFDEDFFARGGAELVASDRGDPGQCR